MKIFLDRQIPAKYQASVNGRTLSVSFPIHARLPNTPTARCDRRCLGAGMPAAARDDITFDKDIAP